VYGTIPYKFTIKNQLNVGYMDPMGSYAIYTYIIQQKMCKYNITYTVPYMDTMRYWGVAIVVLLRSMYGIYLPIMGVSKTRGTPKWMVKIMETPIKMDDLGGKPTIFGNSHIRTFAIYLMHQKNLNKALFLGVCVPKGGVGRTFAIKKMAETSHPSQAVRRRSMFFISNKSTEMLGQTWQVSFGFSWEAKGGSGKQFLATLRENPAKS